MEFLRKMGERFGIESTHGMRDAEYDNRGYGIRCDILSQDNGIEKAYWGPYTKKGKYKLTREQK